MSCLVSPVFVALAVKSSWCVYSWSLERGFIVKRLSSNVISSSFRAEPSEKERVYVISVKHSPVASSYHSKPPI